MLRRVPVSWKGRRCDAVIKRQKHSDAVRSIGVVGSGIAGLTTTLLLARQLLPGGKHRIVLYDSNTRPGGWVRSDRVHVNGKEKESARAEASALVEAGPRSLRPAGLPGLAMLDLIKSLDLSNKLICVPKSHPSAKNRFLYYAGKIHLLPSSILKALSIFTFDRSHPLSKAKIPSTVLRGLFKKREKQEVGTERRWADESIESFLTRRLGKQGSSSLPLLDYVGSAVLHGIYAADASNLSIRSIFGFLWNANLVHGSPARAALPSFMNWHYTPMSKLAERDGDENARHEVIKERRVEMETAAFKKRLGEDYVKDMEAVSVVSFPDGIQTLTDAMVAECRERGVEMRFGSSVESISVSSESVNIRTSSAVDAFDRIVLAQPSSSVEKTLAGVKLPNLTKNPSSTVAVLNLAMSPSLAIQVPPGFGYLVPRACAQEGDNPMGLLGVVFDSVAVPGQDGCSKLTMMFGGPFWKKGFGVHDLVSSGKESAFIKEALSLLAKHLSLDSSKLQDSGIYRRLTLQKDCIVTYSPGHLGRMSELDGQLQQHKRLTLVGASYTGVSLNDCVLYATRTANRLIESEQNNEQHDGVTGLEELIRE